MALRRAGVLLGNEHVADALGDLLPLLVHAGVPETPAVALHVVHDLRGVIQVINVRVLVRRHRFELLNAGQQTGIARPDTTVHAAQQTNRRHGDRAALTGRVAVTAAAHPRAVRAAAL